MIKCKKATSALRATNHWKLGEHWGGVPLRSPSALILSLHAFYQSLLETRPWARQSYDLTQQALLSHYFSRQSAWKDPVLSPHYDKPLLGPAPVLPLRWGNWFSRHLALSAQSEEFPFITLTTGWSLNTAEAGAPPILPLCPTVYVTQHTCGSGGGLESKERREGWSIFQ